MLMFNRVIKGTITELTHKSMIALLSEQVSSLAQDSTVSGTSERSLRMRPLVAALNALSKGEVRELDSADKRVIAVALADNNKLVGNSSNHNLIKEIEAQSTREMKKATSSDTAGTAGENAKKFDSAAKLLRINDLGVNLSKAEQESVSAIVTELGGKLAPQFISDYSMAHASIGGRPDGRDPFANRSMRREFDLMDVASSLPDYMEYLSPGRLQNEEVKYWAGGSLCRVDEYENILKSNKHKGVDVPLTPADREKFANEVAGYITIAVQTLVNHKDLAFIQQSSELSSLKKRGTEVAIFLAASGLDSQAAEVLRQFSRLINRFPLQAE